MLKKYFLLALFNVLGLGTWAQQKSVAVAKDPKIIKLFFEKTYLQTDRSYYSTGETVWFSAYLVNGKSTSLTGTSNNLYVELVSSKSKVLDRKTIRMDGGLGKGDFELKDSIPSGWYSIRAYTSWMRNFGNDFVFKKSIYISNNIVENASYFTRNAAEKDESTASSSLKSITFFPEGGSLVEGLMSIVAFKTNDEQGNAVPATGSVISSKGDTVATFNSTAAGMGIFAFTPQPGSQYRVSGRYGQEKFSASLPVISGKGFSLHVTTDSANIKTVISANAPIFAEVKDKNISILIKHAGDVIYSGAIKLSKPTVSVTIPTKGFASGISALTLLDDQGRPNCERLVYIQGDENIKLAITADKAIYKSREKVTLKVKASNAQGQPVKTSLSLAAVDEIVPDDRQDIVAYLLLQSEIRGEIKNAAQYFDSGNPSRLKQLDLLLLTQGWRDYLWKKLADSSIKISYMPESGLTIKGKVREKLANKPLANMNITLFGSNFTGDKLFTTTTDREGRYFFDGLKWYGNQAIKISSKDDKNKKGGWLQIDTLTRPLNLTALKSLQTGIPDLLNVELGRRMDYNRTYKFGDSITLSEVEIKAAKSKQVNLFDETLTSFGYPEQVFNITAADYSYKGLEHFLLTKANGAMPPDDTDSIGNEGITFIANGKKIRPRIKVNNREELIMERLDYYSLTMDQINQVKIQHLIGRGGNDVFLISLNLKDEVSQGSNLNLLNVNLNGYYNAHIFYSPNYASPSTQSKDLKTTIFWNPAVKTNGNGEATITYYNSDNKGSIRIIADGITDKGVAVTARAGYKIQ
jgi:MG2 domain